jgi:MFS family permease
MTSSALIGFVMTLDNWAAILIQPWIGALSDRTTTRIGRRLPFVAVGVPLAAGLFALIPFLSRAGGAGTALSIPAVGIALERGILPLFLVIMGFNLAMALYRAPVVALMPDLTPSAHRSAANGVINFMGGMGSILAFLGGSYLYDVGAPLPFVATAGIMVVAMIVLLAAIREGAPHAAPAPVPETKTSVLRSLRDLAVSRDRTALFILAAIFFWFLAFNGIETWFTTYGVQVLGMGESAASRMVTAVALAFVLFALPAGLVGKRLGRKRTILAGLGVFIADLAALLVMRSTRVLWVLLGVAGLAWALINVNSITIVWELAHRERVGTYTGLYYFASALAQILSPPALGLLFDRVGVAALFPAALVLMVLAALMMLGVRGGEARGPA